MINISLPNQEEFRPKIIVIGVGGAGGNAVNNMVNADSIKVDFVVANTDAQVLSQSLCREKIQLGPELTQGLGAGANPEIGKLSAEASLDKIEEYLRGYHMCFITAGMGGGTGTGASPVIAKKAKEMGILTIGVVTKPFDFEGMKRRSIADKGILALQDYVDTLIVIPNQNLFLVSDEKTTFAEAFAMADGVLSAGVKGICDLMVIPGLVNLDFADLRTIMKERGRAMLGTGWGEGNNRALEAAEAAISNPLIDGLSLSSAKAILVNICGGTDMTLYDVDIAANRIRSQIDSNAEIIVGSTFDHTINGKICISIVATGLSDNSEDVSSIEVTNSSDQDSKETIASKLVASNDSSESVNKSTGDSGLFGFLGKFFS